MPSQRVTPLSPGKKAVLAHDARSDPPVEAVAGGQPGLGRGRSLLEPRAGALEAPAVLCGVPAEERIGLRVARPGHPHPGAGRRQHLGGRPIRCRVAVADADHAGFGIRSRVEPAGCAADGLAEPVGGEGVTRLGLPVRADALRASQDHARPERAQGVGAATGVPRPILVLGSEQARHSAPGGFAGRRALCQGVVLDDGKRGMGRGMCRRLVARAPEPAVRSLSIHEPAERTPHDVCVGMASAVREAVAQERVGRERRARQVVVGGRAAREARATRPLHAEIEEVPITRRPRAVGALMAGEPAGAEPGGAVGESGRRRKTLRFLGAGVLGRPGAQGRQQREGHPCGQG